MISTSIVIIVVKMPQKRLPFRDKAVLITGEISFFEFGSEVWGFENLDLIERLHLKFLKYVLNLKSSTPDYMVSLSSTF